MIYTIKEKVDALGSMGRYSLLLQKIGCPVGCTDHLPVNLDVFDQLEEGDEIEIVVKKRGR